MADATPEQPKQNPLEQLLAGLRSKIRAEAAKGAREEVRPWVVLALALSAYAVYRSTRRTRG
jgi:hypothetical protein